MLEVGGFPLGMVSRRAFRGEAEVFRLDVGKSTVVADKGQGPDAGGEAAFDPAGEGKAPVPPPV